MQGVTSRDPVRNLTLEAPAPPRAQIRTPSKSPVVAPSGFDAPRSPGAVVSAFYRAFETRDFDRMESLYHPDVQFKDMVFQYGDRDGTMKMWRKILADPTTQLKFTLDRVEGDKVHGHWVADYTVFGRKVHNELTTEMTVKDGKIVAHRDDSDWNKWAPQAFPLGHIATLPGIKQLAIGLIRFGIDR